MYVYIIYTYVIVGVLSLWETQPKFLTYNTYTYMCFKDLRPTATAVRHGSVAQILSFFTIKKLWIGLSFRRIGTDQSVNKASKDQVLTARGVWWLARRDVVLGYVKKKKHSRPKVRKKNQSSRRKAISLHRRSSKVNKLILR